MYEPDQHASTEDMEALAVQKAQELFQVCDKEQKGFINKKDMQRLQKELALDPDQLEAVFDSLDDDGNGFLTLEEFIEGFGSYLGFKSTDVKETQQEDENVYEGVDEGTDEILFKEMLNNVGASRLYDDENAIQGLWTRLRKEDGDMASNFEDFLYKVSNDIRKSKVDFETLESALKSKSLVHDEEVRKLYEEMELQIKQEKERILAEEQLKEQQIKEAMDAEMKEKDKQLQDLLLKHQEMEEKLSRLNMTESETKQENEKLQREKEDLQIMLQKSEEGLEESKSYIDQLRNVSKDEKRERARAALKVTEGIALERESLVKQLDSLRDINQQLRDDKDEAETRRIFETEARTQPSAAKRRDQLSKQGSILGNYFPASRGQPSFGESVSEDTPDVEEDDDIEVDYDDDQEGQIRSSNYNTLSNIVESRNVSYHHNGHNSESRKVSGSQGNTSEGDSDEKSPNDMSSGRSRKVRKTKRRLLPGTVAVQSRQDRSPDESVTNGPRGQPVGAVESDGEAIEPVMTSQRVFKVVFVGDSGVGKSSFIHRFCNNTFNPSFSATIGVDFQVKMIQLKDTVIVLQLWDTAGQERFRSITKQYFRKADGVVIMYDVTSETSFINVRNWMTSIKENVNDNTVIEILGNKTDMTEGDDKRVVRMNDGKKLALEYEALFFECSAKSGTNVQESMAAMADLLKDKEDEEMEKALQLKDEIVEKKNTPQSSDINVS
ncbi:EF-hand calcium-binding domain-containing protein 4A [Mizuhopecten yessoensis]|uniref:EF-hand calcium-binding domain-containing protein 4A n=1 Tax=Mizuhopecten yessoensis TaxID=6573 RepID=A0A210Q3D2_MIZYE|nr:EF-hand calcium-binding domain-containing protein 4A [Mizuhopecten yessoensis]